MNDLASRLRYRFPGSETMGRPYSQAGQDMFVLSMLNGLTQGTYLEIGSCKAEEMSNTALLERKFDWRGVGIEIVPEFVTEYNAQRTNKSFLGDATTADYVKLIADAGIEGNVLDYLSCDCEPPSVTLAALQQVIGQGFQFAIITFEHDTYAQGDGIKQQSRSYLQQHGYVLVASNISESGVIHDFEDWWAHPDLVDPAFIELFKANGDDIKFWANYIYPN